MGKVKEALGKARQRILLAGSVLVGFMVGNLIPDIPRALSIILLIVGLVLIGAWWRLRSET
ncbi:hypothetical protein H5T56_05355 [Candidatus Bipolaricaulota bacterium]|nr:hypothetical protein [Candidatus Bipolaricaulota bacterium]